jgi:UDPglucose 6-dehydrogenase
MKVSVVGAGYVGLVTAACLAEQGHEVVCVDIDAARVAEISAGSSPIYEPGLGEMVARNSGRRLHATTDLAAAVVDSELTLVAVGTPSSAAGIDLAAVLAATREVGAALTVKHEYHVVVVKSTVVPGTTDGVVLPLLEEASGKVAGVDFGVGMNPEFLTEGQAIADFMEPDRLVLGGIDDRTLAVLDRLYADIPLRVPRVLTNPRTAEMIKYASNALLATMISFANEIANLCTALGGVDVVDVTRGVHLSHYLTVLTRDGTPVRAPLASFLEAGCGFGGSCLPKDARALIAEGERMGQPMRVLRAVIETNDAQPDEIVRLLERELGELGGKSVTVLGLAFKPDTDDVRESPATPIVERLVDRGAVVTIHDPVVSELPEALRDRDVAVTADLEAALLDAVAVLLVTRWEEYRAVPSLLAVLDRPPVFVDGRRMLDKESIDGYVGIGMARALP